MPKPKPHLPKSVEKEIKIRILRFIKGGWVGMRLAIPLGGRDIVFELSDVIEAIYVTGTINDKTEIK